MFSEILLLIDFSRFSSKLPAYVVISAAYAQNECSVNFWQCAHSKGIVVVRMKGALLMKSFMLRPLLATHFEVLIVKIGAAAFTVDNWKYPKTSRVHIG